MFEIKKSAILNSHIYIIYIYIIYICISINLKGKHRPKTHNRYTQKTRKESKHNTKDSHQITREKNIRIRKGKKELKKQKPKQLTKWQ